MPEVDDTTGRIMHELYSDRVGSADDGGYGLAHIVPRGRSLWGDHRALCGALPPFGRWRHLGRNESERRGFSWARTPDAGPDDCSACIAAFVLLQSRMPEWCQEDIRRRRVHAATEYP
jgi:hypothetical protein